MAIKNLKIGRRLALGFGIVLILIASINILGIKKLGNVDQSSKALTGTLMEKQKLSQVWLASINTNSVRAIAILKSSDLSIAEYFKIPMEESAKSVDNIQKKMQTLGLSDKEKSMYDNVAKKRSEYTKIRANILKLKENNESEKAMSELDSLMIPALNDYLNSIKTIQAYYDSEVVTFSQSVNDEYESGKIFLTSIAIASMLLATFIAWRLTVGITRPLREALELVTAVANGDLRTSDIQYKSKDEIGSLLVKLLEMKSSLEDTINHIREGADNISTSTKEIAVGNMDLSNRTESQAGVLEETASTVEELTATVKQNADNAKEANKLAVSATAVANQGGQLVHDAISKMKNIKDSSHKIVDIISVIDSIAFQTNILALNAAVEAARAGEQGRGFAVVASEVRNLAQKSATAAKEIKALIADSVAKIEEGSLLVDNSGAKMDEIVSQIHCVMTIINEITVASTEQSISIGQVNQAIGEIDSVTQQNAALVEEAAAAASSLDDQATKLSNLVSTFQLDIH